MILKTKKDFTPPAVWEMSIQLEKPLLAGSDLGSEGEPIIWDEDIVGEDIIWDD